MHKLISVLYTSVPSFPPMYPFTEQMKHTSFRFLLLNMVLGWAGKWKAFLCTCSAVISFVIGQLNLFLLFCRCCEWDKWCFFLAKSFLEALSYRTVLWIPSAIRHDTYVDHPSEWPNILSAPFSIKKEENIFLYLGGCLEICSRIPPSSSRGLHSALYIKINPFSIYWLLEMSFLILSQDVFIFLKTISCW